MPEHFSSLDDLIRAAPTSGPLGGSDIGSSWIVFGFVDVLGATWAVHEDTSAERLRDLRDHLAAGGDAIRVTRGGRRALSTGDSVDGLYVYEAAPVASGQLVSRRPTHALCPCSNIEAPIGSECAFCGSEVMEG